MIRDAARVDAHVSQMVAPRDGGLLLLKGAHRLPAFKARVADGDRLLSGDPTLEKARPGHPSSLRRAHQPDPCARARAAIAVSFGPRCLSPLPGPWLRRPPACLPSSRCCSFVANGPAASWPTGSRWGHGRFAATSTSSARSATRWRPRRGWRAATGSAPGPSSRRSCLTTRRRWPSRSASHRRHRLDRRDRGDLGAGAGQARAGASGPAASPGQRRSATRPTLVRVRGPADRP